MIVLNNAGQFPGATKYVFVAEYEQQKIYGLIVETGEVRVVAAPTYSSPTALAFDTSLNTLYWTCYELIINGVYMSRIRRMSLNGTAASDVIYTAQSCN